MKIHIYLCILIHAASSEYDRRVLTSSKYSRVHLVPRVVNGVPAPRGRMPYLVSIKSPLYKRKKLTVWSNLCGGSIIHQEKVLTAAHCFEFNDFYYAKHPRILRVVAGNVQNELAHSGRTQTSGRAQWRNIKNVKVHQDFVFPDNDIALVFTDAPWKYTPHVNFAVPASRRSDYLNCFSAGYGRIGHLTHSKISQILLIAPIYLLPHQSCDAVWEMNMDSFICSESLVTDVSRGDSGSPLACSDTADPAEVRGRDLLAGVVSGKSYDKTTLYTRVSHYKRWIQNPALKRRGTVTSRHSFTEVSRSNKLYNMLFVFVITFILMSHCL